MKIGERVRIEKDIPSVDGMLYKNTIVKIDEFDKNLAMLLSEITYRPELPVPIGILYQENKATYEQMMIEQMQESIDSKGSGNLEKLIIGNNSWVVE